MSEPCEVALFPDPSQSLILIHKESIKFAFHMHAKEKKKSKCLWNKKDENYHFFYKLEKISNYNSRENFLNFKLRVFLLIFNFRYYPY